MKLIYVSGVPANQPKTDVIAITDFMPKGYRINYKEHAEKLCVNKVKGIFENIGWNISELSGQKTLGELFG